LAQKLLSLDIRQDIVCGMMLLRSGRAATVEGCAIAVVGEEDSLADAVAAVRDHLGYAGEPCRVSLSCHDFFFRNLSFPFHDKRKIDKILAIELEESVIVDIDEVLVDALVTGKKGSRSTVVAAMIDKKALGDHLALLAECGLDPEIVTIAHVQTALQLAKNGALSRFVLVDAGCKKATIYVMIDGRMRLIRAIAFEDGSGARFGIDKNSHQVFAKRPERAENTFASLSMGIRHTLYALDDTEAGLPLYLTGALADVPDARAKIASNLGCDVHFCDILRPPVNVAPECGLWRADLMTSALALGIRSGKKQIGFNFRKDHFGRRVSWERYRRLAPRIAIVLAIGAVIGGAYLWNDYSLRQKEVQTLRVQGESVFKETLPGISRIVDPVQQLQVEIREMRVGALGDAALESDMKMLDLLAEISVRIPSSLNVHVQRLVADRNTILLRGVTDTFNSVDAMKKVLEKSTYFGNVTINSANLAARSSDIRFELRLELKRG